MRFGLHTAIGIAALALAVTALLVAGCGSSSKPAYCSATKNLNSAVDTLKNDATSANISALQSDLSKVEADANAVVSSAKKDFPSQTSAIDSSVSSLKTSIDKLSSPSPEQLLALVPQIGGALNAVQSFSNATSSSCK